MKERKSVDDDDVIHTASDKLDDQDQEFFFYNEIQVLDKRWVKCFFVGGNYVEKQQNNKCIVCC